MTNKSNSRRVRQLLETKFDPRLKTYVNAGCSPWGFSPGNTGWQTVTKVPTRTIPVKYRG